MLQRKNKSSSYIPHIDGLRAVAVLLVLLFHLQPTSFGLGYLGVDIFFVVSGFVISLTLYNRFKEVGKIEIGAFYKRRIKRLLPALFAMLAVTSIVFMAFGIIWDVPQYMRMLLTSMLAVSNLYLLNSADNYFQQDIANPLLHTWSLGIEEQFYLFYPALLVLLVYLFRKHISKELLVFLALSSLSLLLLLVSFTVESKWLNHFYSPITRFWELGLGCALFFLTTGVKKNLYARFVFLASTMLLFILVVFQSSLNVKTEILFVTFYNFGNNIFGTMYSRLLVLNLLRENVVTYIGRISYSLYLWHLPVIIFFSLYFGESGYALWILAVSIILAVMSYHLIENPFRYHINYRLFLSRVVKLSLYSLIGVLLVVGALGTDSLRYSVNDSFASFSFGYAERNFSLGQRIAPNYIESIQNGDNCIELHCYKINPRKNDTTFYLTGDSHALHFVPAFHSAEAVDSFYFKQMTAEEALVFRSESNEKVFLSLLERESNFMATLSKRYDNIFYVLSLYVTSDESERERLEELLQRYVEAFDENINVVFVTPTPVFTDFPENCILHGTRCTVSRSDGLKSQNAYAEAIRNIGEKNQNVFMYRPLDQLCSGTSCRMYDKEKGLLSFRDKDHISVEQSFLLADSVSVWYDEVFKNN